MKVWISKKQGAAAAVSMAAAILAACDSKSSSSGTSNATGTTNQAKGPGEAPKPVEGHSHGGPAIALGEQSIGAFSVSVTRDEGQVIAGKDVAIDATVKPTGTAKVAAVRFWVGTQDATGSVKAKADIEDPKEPNRWHTHADVPNPIPAECRLWVEIEDEAGAKAAASFDLKS